MRVAVVGPAHPLRGGIVHHTTSLFGAFARRHDARFICIRPRYGRLFSPARDNREPPVSPFREPRAEAVLDALDPMTWRRAGRMIREWPADLMVMPWWSRLWAFQLGSVCRAAGPGVRKVFVVHEGHPGNGGALTVWLSRRALGRADAFVVHSQRQLEILRGMFPNASAAVCPHPAYDAFRVTEGREPTRERLGLRGPTLLFFGSVRPDKRLDLALRAFARVRSSIPGAQLLVAGRSLRRTRGPTRRLLRELRLGESVLLVDRYIESAQVGDYFAASDLLLLPYDSAERGGVRQIAIALGLPALAARTGAQAAEPGDGGLIVAPADPLPVADAIARALDPMRLEGLRRAALAAGRQFTWDHLARLIEDLARVRRPPSPP